MGKEDTDKVGVRELEIVSEEAMCKRKRWCVLGEGIHLRRMVFLSALCSGSGAFALCSSQPRQNRGIEERRVREGRMKG